MSETQQQHSNDILSQIGLHGSDRKNGVTSSNAPRRGGDGSEASTDVAARVLRHLVETGKLSLEDAAAAVKSVKKSTGMNSSTSSNHVTTAADTENDDIRTATTTDCKTKPTKKSKQPPKGKPIEKYRTRHIALQFSYDGTDFSGFAQNVGKEDDNSIEKALFAALEKTRLLLNPEEMDMLLLTVGNEGVGDKEKDGGLGDNAQQEFSARTASKYSRCGRTDKGVHANGQVVALYLKSAFPLMARERRTLSTIDGGDDKEPGVVLKECHLPKNSLDGLECYVPPRNNKKKGMTNRNSDEQSSLILKTVYEYDYPRVLNNVLPPSIRILGWCPVSPEFSARFSCGQRTYRYFFPRRNLDLSAMAQGLQYMMGRHDFRNLCKMNCEQVYNFERVVKGGKVVSPQMVYSVSMENEGKHPVIQPTEQSKPSSSRDMCHVEIVGQAFLWHQIRCIMSILFYVGRQLETPQIVQQLFDIQTNPAKPSYEMASETALVLQDCTFGQLELGRTVTNLWSVTKILEQRWEKHALAAERARDAIESVKMEATVKWIDVVEFVEQVAREKRRKEQKRDMILNMSGEEKINRLLAESAPSSSTLSWGDAAEVIQNVLGVYPFLPNGSNEGVKGVTESSVHTPLMERAKGTTYEEKVSSILGSESSGNDDKKSTKRRERYEENIIKKRKTTEEDKAFYDHMLRQGGSSA